MIRLRKAPGPGAFSLIFSFLVILGAQPVMAASAKFIMLKTDGTREVSQPEVKKALETNKTHPVDFTDDPEIEKFAALLQPFVQNLIIPEDGAPTIYGVFDDDMRFRASATQLEGGNWLLTWTWGFYRFIINDDENAWWTGHELEHPISQAEQRALKAKKGIVFWLFRRGEENEVDAKSTLRRVHRKGHNVHAGGHSLSRFLEKFGEAFSHTHTLMESRIDTQAVAVLAMGHEMGEDLKDDQPDQYSDEIVGPLRTNYLLTDAFEKRQRDRVEEALQIPEDEVLKVYRKLLEVGVEPDEPESEEPSSLEVVSRIYEQLLEGSQATDDSESEESSLLDRVRTMYEAHLRVVDSESDHSESDETESDEDEDEAEAEESEPTVWENEYQRVYNEYWDEIERLGFGILSDKEMLEKEAQLHQALDAVFINVSDKVLGRNWEPNSPEQLAARVQLECRKHEEGYEGRRVEMRPQEDRPYPTTADDIAITRSGILGAFEKIRDTRARIGQANSGRSQTDDLEDRSLLQAQTEKLKRLRKKYRHQRLGYESGSETDHLIQSAAEVVLAEWKENWGQVGEDRVKKFWEMSGDEYRLSQKQEREAKLREGELFHALSQKRKGVGELEPLSRIRVVGMIENNLDRFREWAETYGWEQTLACLSPLRRSELVPLLPKILQVYRESLMGKLVATETEEQFASQMVESYLRPLRASSQTNQIALFPPPEGSDSDTEKAEGVLHPLLNMYWEEAPQQAAAYFRGLVLELLDKAPTVGTQTMALLSIRHLYNRIRPTSLGLSVHRETAETLFDTEFTKSFLQTKAERLHKELESCSTLDQAQRPIAHFLGSLTQLQNLGKLASLAESGTWEKDLVVGLIERLIALSQSSLEKLLSSSVDRAQALSYLLFTHPQLYLYTRVNFGHTFRDLTRHFAAWMESPDFARQAKRSLNFLELSQEILPWTLRDSFYSFISRFVHCVDFTPKYKRLTKVKKIKGDDDETVALRKRAKEQETKQLYLEPLLGSRGPVYPPYTYWRHRLRGAIAEYAEWLETQPEDPTILKMVLFEQSSKHLFKELDPTEDGGGYLHPSDPDYGPSNAGQDGYYRYLDFLDERFKSYLPRFQHLPVRVRMNWAMAAYLHEVQSLRLWEGWALFNLQKEVFEAWLPQGPVHRVEVFLGLTDAIENYFGKDRDTKFFWSAFVDPDLCLYQPMDKDPDYLKDVPPARLADLLVRLAKNVSHSDAYLDEIFEAFWEASSSEPSLRERLLDPSLVCKLAYPNNREILAKWQLNWRFSLSRLATEYRSRELPLPAAGRHRPLIVNPILAFIKKQFPDKSQMRNAILTYAQNELMTNRRESAQLADAKITEGNFWASNSVTVLDLTHVLNYANRSHYDRFSLIEYLMGIRKELPTGVLWMIANDPHREIFPGFNERRIRRGARAGKRHFARASSYARNWAVQPLLDAKSGILSDPETTARLMQILLGDYHDDPVVVHLFQSYLDAVPESERSLIVGQILGSYDVTGQQRKHVGIGKILKAMGPLGIKAGQFLRSSGLISDALKEELDEFFDGTFPPDREEIYERLGELLFPGAVDKIFVRQLLGAGSLNYVFLADLRDPQTGMWREVAISVARPNLEGKISNENDRWMKSIENLRKYTDKPTLDVADLLEEVRAHSYSQTLGLGGAELDHRVVRRNYPKAKRAYARPADTTESGFEITVATPCETLQKAYVPPDHDHKVSIYEYEGSVPLKNLSGDLARSVGTDITVSESRARKNGNLDTDPHPGNWLVDPVKRRLVRIDAAQFTQIQDHPPLEAIQTPLSPIQTPLSSIRPPPSAMHKPLSAIQSYLAVMFKPRLDESDAAVLTENFRGVFAVSGSTPGLESAIRQIVVEDGFSPYTKPQERIFHFRKRLEEHYKDGSHPAFFIRLSPATRGYLSSMAKTQIYQEYTGMGPYVRTVAKEVGHKLSFKQRSLLVAADLRDVGAGPMLRGTKVYKSCAALLSVSP